MEMVQLFVPMAAFVMIVVSISLVTRLIATAMLNRTIRDALKTDPGSVPLLADKLEQRQPWADELLGWILLAFAAAIVLLGLFEDSDDRYEMFRAAVVPVVVGLVVILYCRIMAPRGAPKAP